MFGMFSALIRGDVKRATASIHSGACYTLRDNQQRNNCSQNQPSRRCHNNAVKWAQRYDYLSVGMNDKLAQVFINKSTRSNLSAGVFGCSSRKNSEPTKASSRSGWRRYVEAQSRCRSDRQRDTNEMTSE